MVYDAETGARNAEQDTRNDPGYCQQQTRQWSGIAALYGDAATAWANTNDRHPGDKHPPRGAHVFWTGGSSGYGHVGMSLGNQMVRSTDAGGRGVVATRHIDWFGQNWGLPYAGWAWDNNEVTIPHGTPEPPREDPEVSEYVQARRTKEQNVPAGGWHRVNWNQVDAGGDFLPEGWAQIKCGGRRFMLEATLHIETGDDVVRTRVVEVSDDNGDWDPGVVKDAYDAVQHAALGGFVQDTRVQTCNSGNRLAVEVSIGGGGKVVEGRLSVILFPA